MKLLEIHLEPGREKKESLGLPLCPETKQVLQGEPVYAILKVIPSAL